MSYVFWAVVFVVNMVTALVADDPTALCVCTLGLYFVCRDWRMDYDIGCCCCESKQPTNKE